MKEFGGLRWFLAVWDSAPSQRAWAQVSAQKNGREPGAPNERAVYFLLDLNGDGRKACSARVASAFAYAADVHTSPASVVFVTLKKVFGLDVVPVPVPRRIPAQASLTVLLVTVLLFPLPQLSSAWTPDWALP